MSAWKTRQGERRRLSWPTASMGPRRCRRGRRRGRRRVIGTLERLQWGHADVGVEDPGCRMPRSDKAASMGPRRCRRGRPSGSSGSPSKTHASMGPRRCRRGRPGPGCPRRKALGASMGPRRCRRGRRLPIQLVEHPSGSFNGATPMSAWKTDRVAQCTRAGFNGATPMSAWKRLEPSRGTMPSLQWGHADVGVEDGGRS